MSIDLFLNDPWAALAGLNLASGEAHPELDQSSDITNSSYIFQFILSDPKRFVRMTRDLPPFIQDIVFQHYFLGRVQEQIKLTLGCNRDFVWQALQLARKAIVAKACHVSPKGIERIWSEMRRLDRNRKSDRYQLKIVEPRVVGKFRVRTTDEEFETLFAPQTMEGSILKASEC